MSKKLTQEYVAKTCLDLGYTLVSPYVNAQTKITVKSNATNQVYTTLFHSLKQGHKLEGKYATITQEQAQQVCHDLGYTLLSTYVNAKTKVNVKSNLTGNTYAVYFDSLKRGYNPDNRVYKLSLQEYTKKFTQEGYQPHITDYSHVTTLTTISITCPNGHQWKSSYGNFRAGRRCPMCNHNALGGMSRGERIVFATLTGNRIVFEREKTITINHVKHRFDFYLPKFNTMIEYDGRQHYHSYALFPDGSFSKQQHKDKIKDDYCQKHHIKLVRIPYTISNPARITQFINQHLNLKKPLKEVPLNMPDIENVAHFYLTHSSYETKDKYKVSLPAITRYFKITYGMTKRDYIKQHHLP